MYNNGGYPDEQSIVRSSASSCSVSVLKMLNLEVLLTQQEGDIGLEGKND